MSLKYALLEAHLTPAPDDYVAQVQEVKSHDINSLTEKMLQKGSTITKTDTLAVLNSFFEVIEEVTRQGETINLDLFKSHISISGIFDGAADRFDPERHTVHLNMNAGKRLKEAITGISIEKVTAVKALPHVLEVKDSITGSVNGQISSGGVLEIIGSRLKIAGDDPKNGVYFEDSQGKAYKVKTLIENKPARLIVLLPSLEKGMYSLNISTQYSGGGTTVKQARMGSFEHPLSVV